MLCFFAYFNSIGCFHIRMLKDPKLKFESQDFRHRLVDIILPDLSFFQQSRQVLIEISLWKFILDAGIESDTGGVFSVGSHEMLLEKLGHPVIINNDHTTKAPFFSQQAFDTPCIRMRGNTL